MEFDLGGEVSFDGFFFSWVLKLVLVVVEGSYLLDDVCFGC
jgi:hypothetical protein